MPLIYLSCAWLTGIFLGSNFNLPAVAILSGLVPLPLLFFLRRRRGTIILASLILFAVSGAMFYSYNNQFAVDAEQLRYYNDTGAAEVRGIVAADPEVRDRVTHLRLSVSEIKAGESWQPVAGTALVFVPNYPAYRYGDRLEITGALDTPPMIDDFDYRGYLSHQGIYTTVTYPRIRLVSQNYGSALPAWLYSLRRQMALTLAQALPEPQTSLAQAILLGIREAMPQSIKDDFARTGTTHLLAISGLNLTIIAGMLVGIGIRLFGKKHYLYVWLALGVIWLYALLTALSPPVVRGAIMASLFLIAELLGRQRSALTALCFAAAVMTAFSPYILGDASFQLSFLAMASLILIAPALQTLGRNGISAMLGEDGAPAAIATFTSDSLSVSLAAIIAVGPVVAYYFGIFSPAGPLATLLALPVMPGIITTGALTALLGLGFLPLAHVLGWLAWLLLSYMLLVVSLLAKLPFAATDTGSISPAFVWAYYGVLAALLWLAGNRRRLKADAAPLRRGIEASAGFLSRLSMKWALLPLLIITVLVSVTAATMPDNKLHVSFLDVGEGDAIFIQQGNRQILIDGGPGSQALNLALGAKMPFWDRTIDLLILTHPHTDHLAGLVEAVRRFEVKQALYPESDYQSPVYDEWRQLITTKGIKNTIARSGQQIDLGGGGMLEVLRPAAALTDTESDIDNNSLVLRLSCGKVSFLLTADIMSDAERELVRQRAPLAATVLKTAHHGSATSSTVEFLAVVDPQIAVISVGADNKFGHPDEEVENRLAERVGQNSVYRTDLQGTIEFITDGDRLWVETK